MSPQYTRSWCLATIVTVALAGNTAGCSQRAAGAVKSGPCATNPVSRGLDFWVGQWNIATPDSKSGSSSRVTLELDGCLVVERWDDKGHHRGENLFAYSADDASWHGLFADNEGRVHVFVDGKVAAGTAQLTGGSRGPQGETVLNRLTIRRLSDARVEELWEKSTDGGKSWTTAFRGEYAR